MAQLFIGQLPFSKFFPDDLLNLFRPYGNVIAHQLHIRQGNAFVTYATTDEADAAIRALHGQRALGTRSQPIQVMYSKGTRLISPFGLQHRTLCLARNKDHQHSKKAASGGSNTNNDSVSLNDGTSVTGPHKAELATVLFAAGADELHVGDDSGGGNNASGAGVAAFLSRGPSDVSFEEESRQAMGSGAFSNVSIHSLNSSTTRQLQQLQQQQQQTQQQRQAYVSTLLGGDPILYGSPVKWATMPNTALRGPTTTTTTNGSEMPSTPSRLSSPAAPPLPPPAFSYVVMQPPAQVTAAGYGMPAGVPFYYVLPTSAPPSFLSQPTPLQQATMNPVIGAFGTTTLLSPPLAYMQMQPM